MTFYKKYSREFDRHMFWYLNNYVGFIGCMNNYIEPLFRTRKYRNKVKK